MRRYQVGHTTLNTNVLIRVEIHDSLLGVASDDELVGDGTIQYSHQRLDPSQYTEIQSGELGIGVHIQTNAHRTLRNDILNSSEGRFELHLYLGGVFEWKGVILPDLCEFTESFDEVLTLKAKDFTLLKRDLFPLEDKRETIYTTISRIVSGDIVIATSWTESNVGSDFIQNIYHETRALRVFGEDDRQITNEEALRWILRSYGMTLKQSGGKYRIDQFTAYTDPTAVRISTNGGSGANQNVTQVSSPITIDSTNQGNFGIKRVTNTFNHRTEISEPKLPTVLNLEASGLREKTFTFNLTFSGEEVLSLRSVITATSDTEYVGGVVEMTVRMGNQYWDGDRWVEGQRRFKVNLQGGGLQVEGAESDSYAYTGTLSIRSSQVPEENPLEITFRNAKLRTRGGTEVEADATLFDPIEFVIDALSGNDAIGYQIEQAVSFTESVAYPVTYFGDFPNLGSPASLRFSPARADLTNSTWQRIGGGDVRLFHSNLLHEILDPRRSYRRVLNATIKGTFEPHKVLSYDSTYFYYLGGTFDGYTGNWSVQVVEIDVVDQDEQIDRFISEGVGSGGFGQGVNFNLENLRRILLLAGAVGLTNADYDDQVVTSIDLDLNQPLREGFEYWVINSSELNASDIYEGIYSFLPDITGTSNSGLVTLPITPEQTMNAPKGSLVILAPSQAATNQTRMESISSETIGDVTANAEAIVAVDSRVTINEGNISANSSAIISANSRIDDNESAISAESTARLALASRVTINEGDISANSSAILSAQSEITGIDANYRSFIYQGTAPTLRQDGSALRTGDVWIDTTGGDNIQYVWNGTAWVRSNADFDARISTNASATLTLESEVDVIDGKVTNVSAKAALVVDAGGTIGSISLAADGLTGFSEINIKASQVTINGVIFDDDGMMRSTSFNGTIVSGVATTIGTAGWAIDRSGQAIFHNIKIRGGSISGIDLRGNVGNIQIFDNVASLPAVSYADGSAVEEGDAAYVKTKPDSLYRYDGTNWISTVDGSDILANSIVAGKLDVATLSAVSAFMGNVTIGGTTGGELVMKSGGVIKNDATPNPDYQITDTQILFGLITDAQYLKYTKAGGLEIAGSITVTGGNAATNQDIDDAKEDVSVTIRSATAPALRPDGTARQVGDIWIDTSNGDRPNSWNGTAWIQQYTIIDGGSITTGAIESSNFDPGSEGWQIDTNGDAEFNSVIVRNGQLIDPIFIFPTRSFTQAAGTSINALSASAVEVIQIQITTGDGSGGINLNGIVPITVGGNRVGTKVTVMNSLDSVTPSSLAINNQSGSASDVNKIKTPTGTAFSLARGDSAELFYDVNIDRWLIVSSSRVL